MMTKVWNRYSYIIILFTLAFLSFGYLFITLGDQPSYQSITVQEGDTLWTIAKQYNEEYSMTIEEFIAWVGEENRLTSYSIKPGDSLVLPINKPGLSSQTDYQVAMNEE